jgi:C1A family cysteine protease
MRKSHYVRAIAALAAIASIAALGAQTAAAAPAGTQHGMGLIATARGHHTGGLNVRNAPATLPQEADLSKYAPSPGDQGQVGSCASWASAYSAMNTLENEQGITGGPNAPMYLYSQIAKGDDRGSTLDEPLDIAKSQGADAMDHYTQGNFDYTTQPTDAERENAKNWQISGYDDLSTGSGAVNDIKTSIAAGKPVVLGFQVPQSFMDLDAQSAGDYSYDPSPGESIVGGHAITIVGYNDQGVHVENSWGTGWGDKGFVNFPWSFITSQYMTGFVSVGKLVKN